MTTFLIKEYLGIVGNNPATVNSVYNCLANKISSKTFTSMDLIEKLNGSIGAIAYVMDCQSGVHQYNLKYISQNHPQKPLYIFSNQISIPLLHHALKLRVRDVLNMPFNDKAVDTFSLEVSETTNVECFDQPFLPSHFIPPTEELINHPLEELFDIIEQHFVDFPSLKQVSSSLYLSPSRISHMFKDLCGIGYCQYILCRRLEESERRLRQKGASVTNIAYQVGFSNPSHFCRSFKEHVGLTPSGYIKNQMNIELSSLYQRYQKLRMELLPVGNVKQPQLSSELVNKTSH